MIAIEADLNRLPPRKCARDCHSTQEFVDFGRGRFIIEFVTEEKPSRIEQIKRLSLVVAFIIMTRVRWTVRKETFRNFSV